MPQILILADDLSGAADCAGGCAARGLDTIVLLEPPTRAQEASVLAIDLNSRQASPVAAARGMAQAIERARNRATHTVYHKIDSTLRGNWAHELSAARESLGRPGVAPPLALIAPAFPERGRITRAGRVLARSELSQPGGAAMQDAGEIASPLQQLGLKVRTLAIAAVRAPAEAAADLVAETARAGVDALICDAETEADLRLIAAAGRSAKVPLLWVGSAGLMRQLAQTFPPTAHKAQSPAVRGAPLLFVVGSAAQASRAQFDRLAAAADVSSISISAGHLRGNAHFQARPQIEAALDAALRRGLDTAVAIEPGGAPASPLNRDLVTALAQLLAPRLHRFGGLVVTGGETARQLLATAELVGVRLGGEVDVGVPWGVALGGVALGGAASEDRPAGGLAFGNPGLEGCALSGLPIVTKAGAFGDERMLLRCRIALKGPRNENRDEV